jgi:hypothetical protein
MRHTAFSAGRVTAYSRLRTSDIPGFNDAQIGRMKNGFTNAVPIQINPDCALHRQPDLVLAWLSHSFCNGWTTAVVVTFRKDIDHNCKSSSSTKLYFIRDFSRNLAFNG